MTNDIRSSITLAFWDCFEDNVQRDEQWTAPWLKLLSGYVLAKRGLSIPMTLVFPSGQG